MTAADPIESAVAALRRGCGFPPTPARRGPVLLDGFFEETHLSHLALPSLTRAMVASHLRAEGVPVDDVGDAHERLAGFLFLAGRVGWGTGCGCGCGCAGCGSGVLAAASFAFASCINSSMEPRSISPGPLVVSKSLTASSYLPVLRWASPR